MPRMIGTVEIEGRPGLKRDMFSHAVVCTDENKLQEAKERRKLVEQRRAGQQERIDKLETEISEVRGSLGRVEQMLAQLLERK